MWAGDNTNRSTALKKIKEFLERENYCSLDLNNLELDSLPDGIFDLSKMKYGLTCLFLNNNSLSVLPDLIGNLSNLRQLDLSDNSLEILPQAITNLKYLQHLEINNNRLLTIPDYIGNLEELNFLFLKKNPITSAPSSILNLSRCSITLDYSQQIVTVLRTHIEQLDEINRMSIPDIDFDDEDPEKLPVTTINESLKDLYSLVQRDNFSNYETNYPKISRYIQDENLHSNLKEWLSRLRFMIINSIQNKDLLADKILSYLDFAEKDDAFRDKFFGIIEEAETTCGDRMALSILYLGLTLNLVTFDKTDLKGYAHFLIHGPWIVGMLEKIAQSKIDTLKNIDKVDEEKIDPIQVYLAYPVKLKEKLNIQIDVEDMLYFKCSGVTDQDLDSAEKTIKEMLEAPDAIATTLVQRKDWVDALSVEYQSDMDAFIRQRDSELEALTTYDEHSLSLIENVFLQNILDLTKKALANF